MTFGPPGSSPDLPSLRAGIKCDRPVRLDVTDSAAIQAAADAAQNEPIDGLVNNAGISVIGPLELVLGMPGALSSRLTSSAWWPLRRPFFLNCAGAGTHRGHRLHRRSALPGAGAYDSSKFAVEGITDSLRTELHPFGIRVALVEPGAAAAAIWEKSSRDADTLSQSAPPELQAFYARLMSKIREALRPRARPRQRKQWPGPSNTPSLRAAPRRVTSLAAMRGSGCC